MSKTNTDNSRMTDAARAVSTGKASLNGYARLVLFMLRKMRGPLLQVQLPDGTVHEFAGDDQATPPIVLRIVNMSFFKTIVRRGSLGFAEAYMTGDWRSPEIARLLCFFNQNMQMIKQEIDNKRIFSFINRLIHKWRPNSRAGAKRNIHAHYDLGNNFYSLWLDKSMTYSSALFKDSQTDLRAAQTEKYRALAEAIDLQADHHVLEIGCGWGGFAEFAAREIGCRVTGITISGEQLKFARTRIANAGLQDKVDFQFLDYRDVTQTYDRVVSIEMFEAVGEQYWATYFEQLHELLKPQGRAGLQIITIENSRFEAYRKSADFIQRYIFPGGMLPSPEKLYAAFDNAGLQLTGQKDFALDYARTLAAWRARFIAVWPEVEALGFDTRFRNMWEYYLAYCEAGFSTGSIDVSHFTLSK